MSKKWSQFDVAASIAGDESFVGLKDGDNAQFPFADILSYFQSEIDDNFWPLSGTADLGASVTVDGNNFDLIFGSPNPLDDFQVYADNSIYFELGNTSMLFDAAFSGTVTLVSESIFIQATDGGSDLSKIDLDETSGINLETNIGLSIDIDDGLNASYLTFGPDSFELGVGDLGSEDAFLFIVSSGTSASLSSFDSSSEGYSLIFEPQDCFFYDIRSTTKGIEYDADYSAGFTDRSLVDKGYVDTVVSGGTVADGLVPSSTVSGAGSASPAGRWKYITDEIAGPCMAFSDGSNWRRSYDGNVISDV